jgi:TetR/AcrR family transcriptional regulator, transcriptional repressor for nem operon
MLTKAERTRFYIIEKASHLFNKKGFHGTSMSDILEATGLAKGGVYGNFKSKEEIVIEAFEYSFRKVTDEQSIRIKSKNNAVDKLLCMVDYYYNYPENSPTEGGCPMLNYTSHTNDTLPELRKAVGRSIKIMLDTIQRIIEKGQKYGQIKDSVDASLEADLIYTRIEGALMLAKATGDTPKLNRLLEHVKQYILSNYPK